MTTPAIPFMNLSAQYAELKPAIDARIAAVLEHTAFIMGPEVAELERQLAQFVGVKHCLTVASGTDALLIPLMAWGIGPGDEVITSPFSFMATAEVIVLLGAKPVFVDIDPTTCNIDPAQIERAITPRTKVIIPVSLYGRPAAMPEVIAVAAKHDLRVFEDACQSFGGTLDGRRSCSFEHAAATSFFPSKPLGCYGDGGAIFTNDDDLARLCREIRIHGQSERYVHARIGINGRLDTIQAAILLAKLEALPGELTRRAEAARRYDALLQDSGLSIVGKGSAGESAFAQYTVRVPRRQAVQKAMAAAGIPTAVHYPRPLYRQPALEHLGYDTGAFPHTEKASDEVLSLPFDPYIDEATQARVVAALTEAVRSTD